MADIRLNNYRLMRAREGRMLAGVAAGLAAACGMDVTVVRLCIGAMMISGFGVPAYILMWIILPEESFKRGDVIEPAPEQTARIIRISLVALAVLSVFNKIGGWGFTNPHAGGFGFDGVIGLMLVGAALAFLFTRHRPDRGLWGEAPTPPARPPRPPVPAGDDDYDDDEPRTFTGPFRDVMSTVHGAVSDAVSEARTTFTEARPGSASYSYNDIDEDDDYDLDDEPRSRPFPVVTVTGRTNNSGGAALALARIVGWLVLIWWVLASAAVAAGWGIGALTVSSPILLGVASFFVFIGVLNTLLHAKFARAILPALALLLIPIGIGATTVRTTGGVGDFSFAPTNANATMSYKEAVGRMQIDLGATELTKPTTVNARLNVGQIVVVVPRDAAVRVKATTDSFGAYEVLGHRGSDNSPDYSNSFEGCEGGPKLTLNLRVGVGDIEVRRDNLSNRLVCHKAA